MIYYAIIDTNVLVSALISKESDSATVLLVARMIAGEIVPVYSDEIMEEYRNVLNRKKFRFDPSRISILLSAIEIYGVKVEPSDSDVLLPDPKDLPFYEVVLEKREDNAYLVTGNLKHFPVKPFIVTPRQMLEIMDS